MKILNMELLNISEMASGHLCLELTEKISWEDFSDYANDIVNILNGTITSKIENFDLIVCETTINTNNYNLVFDDFPQMVTLESSNEDADKEIEKIKEKLLKIRDLAPQQP